MQRIRIRMTETRKGSPDGRTVYTYQAGVTYDAQSTPPMSAMLANIFLREKWAVVDAPPAPKPAPSPTLKEPPAMQRARKVTKAAEAKEDEAEDDAH